MQKKIVMGKPELEAWGLYGVRPHYSRQSPHPSPPSLTNHCWVSKYSNRENIKQANLSPWLLDFQVSARTFSNKMRLKDFRPLAATVEIVTQCCSGGQVAWQGIKRLTSSTFSTHYRCVGDKNHTGICVRRVHNSRNCHPRPHRIKKCNDRTSKH